MKKIILTALLLTGAVAIYAQEEPKPIKWHRHYIEFGFNFPQGDLGRPPFTSWSVAQNFLSGVYGAKSGFTIAKGARYYFTPGPVRVGLDWTTISFTYNKLEWNQYSFLHHGTAREKSLYGFSMRLGPVVSWRPVGKLVVDIHAQVAPTLQLSAFSYSNPADSTTFSLVNSSILHDFGWKGYFGFGARWSVIGIALDYNTGKINTRYTLGDTDAEGHDVIRRQKIKAEFLQLKATLNF